MKQFLKRLSFFLFVLLANSLTAQDSTGNKVNCLTPEQDSLMAYLVKNQSSVKSLVGNYQSFNYWMQIGVSIVSILLLLWATWHYWFEDWLKSYIKRKAEELTEQMLQMKERPILVLSSAKGQESNDKFLRSFFKEKKFKSVLFQRVGDTIESPEDFEYQLVFANNEDGLLDKSLVRKYITDNQAIFYLGKAGTWDYAQDTSEMQRQINYANSRAQIYGNLMSTMQFLDIIKPRVKNV